MFRTDGWATFGHLNVMVKYIKAKISPSQSGIGRKDYNTWIAVSADCSIETGHCTCPAGNAQSCSHILAIIYAITLAWANGFAGETSTDKKRVWGRGAAQVLSHDMISDMVFDRPSPFELKLNSDKSNEKAATDKPTSIQQFINHSDLQEFVSNSAVKDIWECQGTMLYKMFHAPEESRCPADEIPHQEHTLDSANPILVPLSCNKCQVFMKSMFKSAEKVGVTWNRRQKLRTQMYGQTAESYG
ncbi:hypothetical protein ACJMK2_018882 [Sinanodonta woodiana]|uniref:SWIM-type domain-containing protein n=1 Tax=Sinanodonta woodiana TaxID=1069815 RepID=A0ABD3UGB4_SINWO